MRRISLGTLIGTIILLIAMSGTQAAPRGLSVELRASEMKGAPVASEVKLYGASYALVIGNDAYSGAWPRLSNAVKDAELVAAALRAKGFDVTLKTDLNSRDLVEVLEIFFLETGQDPDARLFLWYAGHGYTERGESYLVPTDAPDPSESGAFLRKALSLRRMGEYARDSAALHILSVFDACFAGTIFSASRAKPPPAITRATTRPVRQFLTAGDAGQEVSDDGTFRKLFIRAINGESRADANGDGYLAATELGLFMTDAMTNYTNGNQTPRNGKLNDPDWDRGDFIFRVKATVTVRAAAPPVQSLSGGRSTEIVFWESIKDSNRASDYKAYLLQYPNGAFFHLARSRVQAFKTQQTTSLTPPKPAFVLEPVEATYVAVKNAIIRTEPDTAAARVETLRKGAEIYVPSKVASKDWLAVDRDGKRLGYVYSKLLLDKEAFDAARAEEANRAEEKKRRTEAIETARRERQKEVKRTEGTLGPVDK